MTDSPIPKFDLSHIDLSLTGMTCAACANRIEKKLNKLDGVTATVNYATEQANVDFDGAKVDTDALVAAIESIGYGAIVPTPDQPDHGDAADAHVRDLRRRLTMACVLGVPVLVVSMVGSLQFRGWQWVALVLATPVAAWSAWPFHRAAWRNLQQAEASMDTLVSVGVLAAWGYSLYALLATGAGDMGMKMAMSLVPERGVKDHLYLEVASTTVALILAGRWFEARAKRRAGGALRALLLVCASAAAAASAGSAWVGTVKDCAGAGGGGGGGAIAWSNFTMKPDPPVTSAPMKHTHAGMYLAFSSFLSMFMKAEL